jgi:cell division protein FtsL
MTKVLFILAALVMAVSAVFAYQNGRKLTELRNDAISNEKKSKIELQAIASVVEEIGKVSADAKIAQTNLDTETEKLKNFKLKASQLTTENTNVTADYKTREAKMAELNAKLAKLPAGFNPQTIAEDLNKIRQEIVELQTAAETKKGEVTAEQDKLTNAEKQLSDVVAKVEARKKAFERNGLEATIVAVNADWGFVVINAGEKEGIAPDTRLIITRGQQTVGKLSILTVNGNRTVANVLTDTLAPGMSPSPGDRVLLENLIQ